MSITGKLGGATAGMPKIVGSNSGTSDDSSSDDSSSKKKPWLKKEY